jgi:ABC-2 type transport system ATP-binding protein
VILRGRLRDVGRITDLLSPRVRNVEVVLEAPEGAREAIVGARVVSREHDRFALSFPDLEAANAAVARTLAAGGSLVSLVPHRETLEDFFMRRLEEGRATGDGRAAPPGA